MTGHTLTIRAHAKINLTLEVLGKRPDGYHEIASVMQTISLADEVSLDSAETLSLDCVTPGLGGQDNLALRAAALLREASGYAWGGRITLTKHIPVAAGLGGGSSDAATVLAGLDRLWGLHWPRERLAELAARLGSDVPFFLSGGTALAQGRGERITPLSPLPTQWLVLLPVPAEVASKTATLYGRLRPAHYTDGEYTREVCGLISAGKVPPPSLLYNAFEPVAAELAPELARHWQRFLEAGARHAHLAGSGPSLYTMVDGEEEGRALCRRLGEGGLRASLVHTVSPPVE